ncbi:hypothetical protein OR16_01315 [Cupriavidus basilensis OR16]|uniref:LRAT domain-containing protein n=1 Tax=Cupriavidus basilensis OR16 TaxID=1127483 RepID=H1RYD8_9BURK|nr:lecithin retinol acyltransferase family protein [Cupriavidus basilensis]EHP44629.1 hypothetical protein OR16_01315 [Cupriavidus basilensis OR16]
MNDEHSPAWPELASGTTPVPDAHLVTLRCGYCHHGIYVGDGKVVQYAGYCRTLHHGPVEEIDLVQFSAGQQVWIDASMAPRYPGHEVVRRARSRLDEDSYRLLTNNCEHFCAWCLAGESRSEQVQAWRAHPRSALRSAVRLVKAFHSSLPAIGSPAAGAPSALLPGHTFALAGWLPSP